MAATLVPSVNIVHRVLNQDNYELWSLRVKSYLVARDLWSIVKPTNEPPKQEDNEVEFKVWSNRNAEALHAIQICCGDDMFPFVCDFDTAKAAWDNLEAKFKQLTISQIPDAISTPNLIAAGDAPSAEAPVPLATVEDFRREFHCDPGEMDDAEIELILRVMRPLIPDYGFRNAFFIMLAKTGSLDGVRKIHSTSPEVIKARSLSTGETALHSAVYGGHVQVVKELVGFMSAEDLELLYNGKTALISAAQMGFVEMAKCMIEKNERLLTIRCDASPSVLPILFAVYSDKWEMVRYLYSLAPVLETITKEENGRTGAQILSSCLYSQELDIALDLIRRCPALALAENYNGETNLYILTSIRSLFLTGTRIGLWQKLIYKSIQIQPSAPAVGDMSTNVVETEDGQGIKRNFIIHSVMGWFQGFMASLLEISGVNHIRKKKFVHIRTLEILGFMSQAIRGLSREQMQESVVQKAILQAVERGNVEFVRKMCDANFLLYMVSDGKGKQLLHYSIECRQEQVYCLLSGSIPRHAREQGTVNGDDKLGNTILHSAGSLSPVAIAHLNQIQGAALQLQRELQWFKEVESIVPPKVHEMVNYKDRMTARELFTENHKEMLKDGERQMKEIATSSTVVGALIVTMMFASAFTVPGGTNGDTGIPLFSSEKMFKVFIVSNSISLFASTTSIVILLGILTSRYAENDFLKSLPIKMVMGLSTLFLSIASMMIAFVSAMIIMLKETRWIIFLVVMLATIPISSFAWMQFPLLVEMFISTFGRGVFYNKVELW